MKTNTHFRSYRAQFFLECETIQELTENRNIYILCSVFFSPENRMLCEIMRKYIVERSRPQMIIIWRMLIACSIPNTTNTNSVYVTLSATMFARIAPNVTSYLRYLSCYELVQNRLKIQDKVT